MGPMRSIAEMIRGARHIELFILLLLVAALGLLLINNTGGNTGSRTDVEARLERLLHGIDGIGDVDVMISTDADGVPAGAAVVVGGRLDMSTRLEIQSAIQALLDIETNRIRIIGKGGYA